VSSGTLNPAQPTNQFSSVDFYCFVHALTLSPSFTVAVLC